MSVNRTLLAYWLKRRRQQLGLSLRDVEARSGLPASTLSRLERAANTPDLDTLTKACIFLEMPPERFLKNPEIEAAEPTDVAVSALIRRDRRLTGEQKDGLDELFRVAYRIYSRQ